VSVVHAWEVNHSRVEIMQNTSNESCGTTPENMWVFSYEDESDSDQEEENFDLLLNRLA